MGSTPTMEMRAPDQDPGFESRPHTLMGQIGLPQRVEVRSVRPPSNKRLKLAARVDYGMSLSSARRSLSAIR